MMPIPPDAPLTMRLGARLGPEMIASVLVAAIVVAAVGLTLSSRRGVTFTPSQVASAAPSVAAVPSGSALPTASAASSPSGPSSPPSSPARALLEFVDRLATQRVALSQQAASRVTDAAAIADLLRNVIGSLNLMDGHLTELAAEPGREDLVSRIRTMNEAARYVAGRALQASITNAAAYKRGAEETVAAFAPLAGIRAELASLAGE
jgi:hypothetical protein